MQKPALVVPAFHLQILFESDIADNRIYEHLIASAGYRCQCVKVIDTVKSIAPRTRSLVVRGGAIEVLITAKNV